MTSDPKFLLSHFLELYFLYGIVQGYPQCWVFSGSVEFMLEMECFSNKQPPSFLYQFVQYTSNFTNHQACNKELKGRYYLS